MSVAKDFDGIALLVQERRAIALWADEGGLFARELSLTGEPAGEVERLWSACDGGFDALGEDEGISVACLSRARGGKHLDSGGVYLLHIDWSLGLRGSRCIGTAGSLSEGVGLARIGGGLHVVWHDASPDTHRVWWALLRHDGGEAELLRGEPRVLSRAGHMAAAPSIAPGPAGEPRVVWVERWVEGEELRSEVVRWKGKGEPQTTLPLVHLNAMPQLVPLGRQLLLAYRDQPKKQRKPGLYLVRLDDAGDPMGEPVRVGRADGIGRPELRACMNGLVAATPRTYGGDYFVGINWLDDTLDTARGEQQFYEDTHAFTRAAAACTGDSALLLIAEYGQREREETALRAVPYSCE